MTTVCNKYIVLYCQTLSNKHNKIKKTIGFLEFSAKIDWVLKTFIILYAYEIKLSAFKSYEIGTALE